MPGRRGVENRVVVSQGIMPLFGVQVKQESGQVKPQVVAEVPQTVVSTAKVKTPEELEAERIALVYEKYRLPYWER